MLERLGSSSDRLASALTALGRLVKTTYILRYLNFANHGAFRSGDYDENKVSAVSRPSNAALVWNTVRVGKVIADPPREGR